MMMMPTVVCVAKWAWRLQVRAAAIAAPADGATTRVRVTSVVVFGRSVLVGIAGPPRSDGTSGGDQILAGKFFADDVDAGVAVLEHWRAAESELDVYKLADRLTFEAPHGSSIVLARPAFRTDGRQESRYER